MLRQRLLESNIVGIGNNKDETKALEEALSYLPWDNFIQSGSRVTITANLVNPNPPQEGVTVGQKTLQNLIRIIKQRQPGRVVVAGGSGGASTAQVLSQLGYDSIVRDEGIEFIDLNTGEFINLELKAGIVKATKVNRLITETDVLISLPS
jgi:uncharacterized protein (DUF362 family)